MARIQATEGEIAGQNDTSTRSAHTRFQSPLPEKTGIVPQARSQHSLLLSLERPVLLAGSVTNTKPDTFSLGDLGQVIKHHKG